MTVRQNVYTDPDEFTEEGQDRLVGWFDLSKAEEFREDYEWDGNNNISRATGSQWAHEILYRTAGGRWVLHEWSQWQGTLPRWSFATDNYAREWLLRNGLDKEAELFFGEIEEERGPGRPEIGPAINVRLPSDLLARVDAQAEREKLSRAEMIRRLVDRCLSNTGR